MIKAVVDLLYDLFVLFGLTVPQFHINVTQTILALFQSGLLIPLSTLKLHDFVRILHSFLVQLELHLLHLFLEFVNYVIEINDFSFVCLTAPTAILMFLL